MLKKLIEIRSDIYVGLIIVLLASFTVSFAISSIVVFLFVPFFFLDTRKNINSKFKLIKNQKIPLLYSLFFLVQLIGLLYTNNLDFGLKRVSVMLPLFFLPSIICSESLSRKHFESIINISKFFILATFLVYIFIHVVIDAKALNTFVHFTIQEKLGVSQFYLMFILLLPILASINELLEKKRIVINAITLIISLGISFLLGNKTMLFFISLLWLIVVIKTFKIKKRNVFIPLVLGAILFFSALQVPIVKQRIEVFTKTIDFDIKTIVTKNSFTITKNTLEHRILINHLAIKQIEKSFPFGVGTGDNLDALKDEYKRINFKAAIASTLNNHNQYLEEFLKTGIFGGLLFIILIFNLLKRTNINNKFYIYYITFFAFACLLESYLVRQHGIVIFAFLIPFFLYNDKNIQK